MDFRLINVTFDTVTTDFTDGEVVSQSRISETILREQVLLRVGLEVPLGIG